MSVLLPSNSLWGVANWVSHGFFHECVPFLGQTPRVAGAIRFCIEAEVDTLDLRDAGADELAELEWLARKVLEAARVDGGARFHEPSVHRVYVAKLELLLALAVGEADLRVV